MSNTNHVAVVTGASRGLGLAIVQEFSRNGWQVIGTGRSPRPQELPEIADYQKFDASDAAACQIFWRQISDKYSDARFCLVNNAGGYVSGVLTELEPHDYMQQMQSIYFAAVYMTRSLAEVIDTARVINVLSTSALGVYKGDAAYGPAKAAERHFFEVLQLEYQPNKYRITNIYPTDIASHGPNPAGITPQELAEFIRGQAENVSSYYLSDVTVYPSGA
jgi:3-oxoacyl-[acyl-carrier protein] reductase